MNQRSRYFWILALLCFLSLFLFLGESHFHTRGEPREALVAYAMLEDENWTLPTTNGIDIAYKPPLFHWCIAAISGLTGEVTEYTSRMPSAIALAVMTLMGFWFYAKRRGVQLAFLASLLTLTNFEVHRAGVNCRVDMLLSALMVLALYALYQWYEKKLRGIPWWAILCLSGAFLTKGPVGLVLPCLVVAILAWIRGIPFFRIFFSFLAVAIGACVLPTLWYMAAYQQGGEAFLTLVLEENILRFLGKMTYASHENPWHYNVMTIVAGFIPYTLLVLLSIFTLKFTPISCKPKTWGQKFVTYIKGMDDTRLFSLLSIVIMFVFYCIPKSKRSVYLLPVYPFIAYFLAEYILYLVKKAPQAIKGFNGIIASLGILLTGVFFFVQCEVIPHSIFQGKHATENIAYLSSLEDLPLGIISLSIILFPLLVGLGYFLLKKRYPSNQNLLIYGGGIMTFVLFFALDGIYQPTVLNVKSNKPIAEKLQKLAPEGLIYSYITDSAEGNRLHPFSINFYLGDRIVPFIEFAPKKGVLLLGEREVKGFKQKYGATYTLQEQPGIYYKSCDNRDMTRIYHFKRKEL